MAAKGGNWFWAVPSRRARQILEVFLKLAVVRGAHYGEVLEEVLSDYNRRFLEHTGLDPGQLVEEAELLSSLSKAGLGISRRTLWKHRKTGRLVDDGLPLFYESDHKVVYNLGRCMRFYKKLAQT